MDDEVVLSPEHGYLLVTSRKPADLPAFCREAVQAFAKT